MEFEDQLSNIAADLLSEKRFDSFVRYLLALPSGHWVAVAECCSGIESPPDFAVHLFINHVDAFVVPYLLWPGSPMNWPDLSLKPDYVLVVFAHSNLRWATSAVYNRAVLNQK